MSNRALASSVQAPQPGKQPQSTGSFGRFDPAGVKASKQTDSADMFNIRSKSSKKCRLLRAAVPVQPPCREGNNAAPDA